MSLTSSPDPELALGDTIVPNPSVSNNRTPIKWIWFKRSPGLIVVMFTFNIPAFHASLGRISGGLGIRAAISVWKAVRTIDNLLVATLIAVLLKADPQAATSFWFFCSLSLLQAVIGLISSTVLIIYFSATNNEHAEVVDQLDDLFWSVWHLFSVPSIWTSWSVLTFTITLLISVAYPNTLDSGVDGDSSQEPARAFLLVFVCLSAVFFVFFLFHLFQLSRILTLA